MKAESSRAPYYIKFHIGDYIRDCEELSLLQHGSYLRLMLWYYSTGRPIPNDLDRVYRRVHATSIEERQAVQYVLAEFFLLQDGVWKHKRIEQELQNWTTGSAQAKYAVSQRRDRNINKNNETTFTNVQRTLYERSTNQNQEPEPRTKNQDNYIVAFARDVVSYLNSKTGKAFRPQGVNLKLIEARLKDGATVEQCKAVIDRQCKQWRHDPEFAKYLRPATLFNATKFEQYLGECNAHENLR